MDQDLNAAVANEAMVFCINSQGLEIRGAVLHLTRFQAAFEVYHPAAVLRLSEVLSDFKIMLAQRTAYCGKAVVTSIVNTGSVLVCEAALEEAWRGVDLLAPGQQSRLRAEFAEFVRTTQTSFKIQPEFKSFVADASTVLANLRLWLEQIELALRSSPSSNGHLAENQVAQELEDPVAQYIDALWEKFEPLAEKVDPELRPVHRAYLRRHLHPLILCSPFAYRTFTKPLGYAGDYESVNMIVRPPEEGSSLFAKMLNVWLLQQPPAVAHRNRLEFLCQRLLEETIRVQMAGRKPRILNLGCGPAVEVQTFLAGHPISSQAHITLVDFNDETLRFAEQTLAELNRRHARAAAFQILKKSVQQLLKESSKAGCLPPDKRYDFVYCAGLFDYLPDIVCRRLLNLLYQWLAPGGLLLATNVDATKPFRHSMDYLLEWHLVCRSARQLLTLLPEGAPGEACSAKADLTGVNVFLEVRKPSHA